jgi:hypothetical protein
LGIDSRWTITITVEPRIISAGSQVMDRGIYGQGPLDREMVRSGAARD